jgi:hypothetical protein
VCSFLLRLEEGAVITRQAMFRHLRCGFSDCSESSRIELMSLRENR